MKTAFRSLLLFGFLTAPIAASILVPSNAWGQYTPPYRLVTLSPEGEVFSVPAPNQGRVHTRLNFELSTADYFRGVFDGVEESGDLAYQSDAAIMMELWHEKWFLHDTSITIGMENGLSDTDPFPGTGNLDTWYESNLYAGIATQLPAAFMLGIGYTNFTSPSGALPTLQEITLALKYAGTNPIGWLRPYAQVAFPIDTNPGTYLELGAVPGVTLLGGTGYPLTLAVPLVFGMGLDDYYVEDETGSFFETGLLAALPFVNSDRYGIWSLFAGLHVIIRGDTLADAEETAFPFIDDAGNTVVSGRIGLGFHY
jgi:hypothetical protein